MLWLAALAACTGRVASPGDGPGDDADAGRQALGDGAVADGGGDGGAVADGGVAGGGMDTEPNLIPQAELFECTGAASQAPTRLRRLNRWQWTRNVGGAVTRDWTGFSYFDNPLDPSSGEPYSTYARDETLASSSCSCRS